MRLFKRHRSCPKPGTPAPTEESQKSKGVFRLFNGAGAALGRDKESAAEAIVVCLDDASSRKPPAAAAVIDVVTDGSSANFNFINQNYSPSVGLSPEATSRTPAVLPLLEPTDAHNRADARTNKEAKEKELARFQLWQRRRPHFHFGPRDAAAAEDGGAGGAERRGSASASSAATSGSENVIALPPKYAYVYQDGKFVEREVTKWPKKQQPQPHLRYRVMEPYASTYGKRYLKRISTQERFVPVRYRLIYNSPIYVLPRKMMEENKSRLMTRHSLKNRHEGPIESALPQTVEICESQQSKMAKNMAEKCNQKEAEKLVNYMSRKAKKAGKTS